jgi:hypothetical protein
MVVVVVVVMARVAVAGVRVRVASSYMIAAKMCIAHRTSSSGLWACVCVRGSPLAGRRWQILI